MLISQREKSLYTSIPTLISVALIFRFCQMKKKKGILICLELPHSQAMVDHRENHFMIHIVGLASSSMECLFKILGPNQDKLITDFTTRQSYQRVTRSLT